MQLQEWPCQGPFMETGAAEPWPGGPDADIDRIEEPLLFSRPCIISDETRHRRHVTASDQQADFLATSVREFANTFAFLISALVSPYVFWTEQMRKVVLRHTGFRLVHAEVNLNHHTHDTIIDTVAAWQILGSESFPMPRRPLVLATDAGTTPKHTARHPNSLFGLHRARNIFTGNNGKASSIPFRDVFALPTHLTYSNIPANRPTPSIVSLDSRGDLAIAEIVFYAPALLISVWIDRGADSGDCGWWSRTRTTCFDSVPAGLTATRMGPCPAYRDEDAVCQRLRLALPSGQGHLHSSIFYFKTPNVFVEAFMLFLMEAIVVSIYMIAGLTTPKQVVAQAQQGMSDVEMKAASGGLPEGNGYGARMPPARQPAYQDSRRPQRRPVSASIRSKKEVLLTANCRFHALKRIDPAAVTILTCSSFPFTSYLNKSEFRTSLSVHMNPLHHREQSLKQFKKISSDAATLFNHITYTQDGNRFGTLG
ncbi:uncharacterized protein MYCFIDRAFT_176664 [Pseudocercospora fijiensis CIRAD86]|uniref:Uncharacterized protein n=1 Tax=Pseudocercospora fijiensis (strain CIRAD86) TaxID=383855 RepID=M3A9S7_PSEFD|nr:uncharacterized protein MYCFIDRAFT_176664 [Pseudocercospora fijiensis CIRAD86]EME81381.1 hypothetical protein MYCFIDRAFT_176664 [Pseudocercospora fijiensis CIRAD86]